MVKGIQDFDPPWTLKWDLPMPLVECLSYSGNDSPSCPISLLRGVSY